MIGNLAVADLMVALFCLPVTLVYTELKTWPFGYAMCKILPFVQTISVMGSIGTLTIISIGKKQQWLKSPRIMGYYVNKYQIPNLTFLF